ncbi:MAG: hypothetical protein ABI477_23940 [Chryseolinea sp.]
MAKDNTSLNKLVFESRRAKKILKTSFVLAFLIAWSCDSSDERAKRGELEVVFQYSQNYRSFAKDIISNSDGFFLLIDELPSPVANTIIKIDNNFNVIWKIAVEYTFISKILLLPNGKLIAITNEGLITIQSDGSSSSWFDGLKTHQLHALVVNEMLLLYGVDENYKAFMSAYDFDLNLIWEQRTAFNAVLDFNGKDELSGVNGVGDTLRTYDLDGILKKQLAIKSAVRVAVSDLKTDPSGNVYILGVTNYAGCCCDDQMSISSVSPSAAVNWFRTTGGSDSNSSSSTILVYNGDIYITGAYGSPGTCIGGDFDGGSTDVYMAKYDINGNKKKEYLYGDFRNNDDLTRLIILGNQTYGVGKIGADDTSSKATIFRIVN